MEITISGITVKAEQVGKNNTVQVCSECCFSFEGRSQRNCPKLVNTDGSSQNLCTAINDGTRTYFKEI